MESYKRTFKLLYTICKGKPIVSKNWVNASIASEDILPFESFPLQISEDPELIQRSINKVRDGFKLFEGLYFSLIEPEEMYKLKY